jgi:hypothetical protein
MKAQAALLKLFGGRPITMRPQPDRTYIAEGEYFPLLALSEDFPDKTATPVGFRGVAQRWLTKRGGYANRLKGPDKEFQLNS